MKSSIEIASEYFGIPVADIRSPSRIRPLVLARNLSFAACAERSGAVFAALEYNRHRTYVYVARMGVSKETAGDEVLRRDYENLQRLVAGLEAMPRLGKSPKFSPPGKRQGQLGKCECNRGMKVTRGGGCQQCEDADQRNADVRSDCHQRPTVCYQPYTANLPSGGRNYE